MLRSVSCVAKGKFIIVSCQGDTVREAELLTLKDASVCGVTAWTTQVSL